MLFEAHLHSESGDPPGTSCIPPQKPRQTNFYLCMNAHINPPHQHHPFTYNCNIVPVQQDLIQFRDSPTFRCDFTAIYKTHSRQHIDQEIEGLVT